MFLRIDLLRNCSDKAAIEPIDNGRFAEAIMPLWPKCQQAQFLQIQDYFLSATAYPLDPPIPQFNCGAGVQPRPPRPKDTQTEGSLLIDFFSTCFLTRRRPSRPHARCRPRHGRIAKSSSAEICSFALLSTCSEGLATARPRRFFLSVLHHVHAIIGSHATVVVRPGNYVSWACASWSMATHRLELDGFAIQRK